MEWYAPLTVLPAIALIILSTSGFIVALNKEITQLERDIPKNRTIIHAKMKQLRRLGIANSLLYTGVLFYLFSSLIEGLVGNQKLFNATMIIGTLFFTLALALLFIHSVKAVAIRQKHLSKDNDS